MICKRRSCKHLVIQLIVLCVICLQIPLIVTNFYYGSSTDDADDDDDENRDIDINFGRHFTSYNYSTFNASDTNVTVSPETKHWLCPSRNCSEEDRPLWQTFLWHPRPRNGPTPYYLTEVLKVRLYESDKAKWTIRELKQWIHYLLYAGVEHIYLCDRRQSTEESVEPHLQRYIKLGLVSYFNQFARYTPPRRAQIKCYQFIIDTFKYDSLWQMSIDMDEYPFIMDDFEEGFLARYLQTLPKEVSELSMHNYLMLGQGDRKRDMIIDRINRITPKTVNNLHKPIYKPTKIRPGLHHTNIKKGKRMEGNGQKIRMLHYWGGRGQNWGPDTPEILAQTVEFNVTREMLAPVIRQSLLAFGEFDAFSNVTGP